jgi:hypothetical protein
VLSYGANIAMAERTGRQFLRKRKTERDIL